MAFVRAGENFNGTKAVAIASTNKIATTTLIADMMACFVSFNGTVFDMFFDSLWLQVMVM